MAANLKLGKSHQLRAQAFLLYIQAEKRRLLEDIDEKQKEFNSKIETVLEFVTKKDQLLTEAQEEIRSFNPAEIAEQIKNNVALQIYNMVDEKQDKFITDLTEVFNKGKKSKKKVETPNADLAVTQQINQLKNMVQRLQFTSGGGGFAGGNLEQYLGVKHVPMNSKNGALIFDCVYGNTFDVTLAENINNVVLKNWPSETIAQRIVVYLRQDSVGNRTITGWPSNILWPDGELPVLSPTPDAIDCLVFETFDAGANVFGNIAGQNYKQV